MAAAFDWASLVGRVVDETPPDIVFRIIEGVDGDMTSDISAHKNILSMASLTFRNMFKTSPGAKVGRFLYFEQN